MLHATAEPRASQAESSPSRSKDGGGLPKWPPARGISSVKNGLALISLPEYTVARLMESWGRIGRVLLAILAVAILAARSQAVLFEATGDPSYNTNAPTGSLTNSGWQCEGQWYVWLGTPIAPTFFLTAHHINGNVGDPFILNGFSYTTVANFDDPNSDLRIWQVAQTFPYYAPLYTGSNEIGNTCVVIGRGTDRGPAVIVGGVTNGWQWGNTNNIERWGENTVSGVVTGVDTEDGNYPSAQLLYAAFQRNGMTNECDLSYNDSGGGMFIQDGGSTGTWKLAGIHCTVDDPFVSTNGATGPAFNASLVDYHDLYYQPTGSNWVLFTAHYAAQFYSSRVSPSISWINSVINYNLGNDLGITGVQIVGSDAQISLITGSSRYYRVDYTTNVVAAIWTTLTNNIPGTGGTVTVTDPGGASLPARYYRAAVLP